jgi:hypothetical protein
MKNNLDFMSLGPSTEYTSLLRCPVSPPPAAVAACIGIAPLRVDLDLL